jgi:hypothetical protein
MIPHVSLASTVLFLFVFVQALSPARPNRCSCGSEPGAEIAYSGQASESFRPGADLIAISPGQSGETVRIEASLLNEQGLPQGVYYHTTNFGRTWVKESAKIRKLPEFSDPTEFSRPPMRYRLPLAGGGLERSSDDGKLWRKALLQLNNPPTMAASGRTLEVNQSRWRVELASIHPANPNTIYGCFSALTYANKSEIPPQQFTNLPGIYVSTDGGDHWSLFSGDFNRRSFEEPCLLGINPSNPEMMVLHARSGVTMTRDGGKNWTPVGNQRELEKPAQLRGYEEASDQLRSKGIVPPKQWPYDWTYLVIMSVAFEPRNESVTYLVTNKGLYKTQDGGRSWCLIHSGFRTLFGVRSIFIDDRNPSRLFVGVGSKILYSKDGGCHFEDFLDSAELPL